MKVIRYFIIPLLLVTAWRTQAQTVLDTARTWVSTGQVDLYSGQAIADTVTFYLSKATLRLTHQGVQREFAVSNVAGSWQNISHPGEVTFAVQVLDLAGKGKLANENGTLWLILDLSERKDWLKRKFIITH